MPYSKFEKKKVILEQNKKIKGLNIVYVELKQ